MYSRVYVGRLELNWTQNALFINSCKRTCIKENVIVGGNMFRVIVTYIFLYNTILINNYLYGHSMV